MKPKSEKVIDGQDGSGVEYTQTFPDVSPEALQSMESMANDQTIDYVDGDGTYYYYTDGEATKVSECSFK